MKFKNLNEAEALVDECLKALKEKVIIEVCACGNAKAGKFGQWKPLPRCFNPKPNVEMRVGVCPKCAAKN